MASLKKRGRSYSVQFYWEGRQRIYPLRMESEDVAERYRAKVEAAVNGLKRGRYPVASRLLSEGYDIIDVLFPNQKTAHLLDSKAAVDDGNPLTLSELQGAYLNHLQDAESDGHFRRIKSKFRHLVDHNDRRMVHVDSDFLDEYVKSRRKSKAGPQTIKNEITAIRAMMKWAVQTNRLDELPLEKFPTVKVDEGDPFLFKRDIEAKIESGEMTPKKARELGKRMVLEPDDIDRLVSLAKRKAPNLSLPLMLVAATGIRRSELVRLHRIDFDPQLARLTVHSGQGSKKKRRTTRTIDIHDAVLPTLQEHFRSLPKKTGWLLPVFEPTIKRNRERPDEDCRADRAGRLIADFLDGTEFELLGGWHALRHSFITICVWKGMTFDQLSQWSGHIDPETQRRYTHYSGEASRRLMNKLPFHFKEAKS